MKARRAAVVVLLAVLVLVIAALVALPGLVHRIAVARLEAMTHRPVRIDRVDFNIFTGRLTLHGFDVADRPVSGARATAAAATPPPRQALTHFERLDLRFSPLSLLRGHIWIRDVELHQPTVRIVRFPDGLNVADLLQPCRPRCAR